MVSILCSKQLVRLVGPGRIVLDPGLLVDPGLVDDDVDPRLDVGPGLVDPGLVVDRGLDAVPLGCLISSGSVSVSFNSDASARSGWQLLPP